MKYSFYIILIFASLLTSCASNDECRENIEVNLNAKNFVVSYDESQEKMVPRTVTLPLQISGLDNDSLLYNSTISSFKLPLNKLKTSSSFILTLTQTNDDEISYVIDTISIEYKNIEEFISLECGCVVNATIDKVSHTINAIDSIIIESIEVERNLTNNLKVYFKQ